MLLEGFYGMYNTYYYPTQRHLPSGVAGCRVVEDKGETLLIQPMRQGDNGRLAHIVGKQIVIPKVDFHKCDDLAPLAQ
jgi:hypothetical protein